MMKDSYLDNLMSERMKRKSSLFIDFIYEQHRFKSSNLHVSFHRLAILNYDIFNESI